MAVTIEAVTGKIGKDSGESTLKKTVWVVAALPTESDAYKVTLCAPLSKPVKVMVPVIV
jgi:hypothetical protein